MFSVFRPESPENLKDRNEPNSVLLGKVSWRFRCRHHQTLSYDFKLSLRLSALFQHTRARHYIRFGWVRLSVGRE